MNKLPQEIMSEIKEMRSWDDEYYDRYEYWQLLVLGRIEGAQLYATHYAPNEKRIKELEDELERVTGLMKEQFRKSFLCNCDTRAELPQSVIDNLSGRFEVNWNSFCETYGIKQH